MHKKHKNSSALEALARYTSGAKPPLTKELISFLALYENGSFTEAAIQLDQDQGNLSKSVKRLEDSLSARLFHRYKSGVRPTDKGTGLYEALKQMGDIWFNIQQSDFQKSSSKHLKIGAHKSIAKAYFPKIFDKISQLDVPFVLEPVFDTSINITQAIINRDIDFGIIANPVKSDDIILRKIAQEDIDLCNKGGAVENTTLLINPDMLYLQKILTRLSFKRVLRVSDYEIAASICEENSGYTTIIPSSITSLHSKLNVVQKLKSKINISLMTYPNHEQAKLIKIFHSAFAEH